MQKETEKKEWEKELVLVIKDAKKIVEFFQTKTGEKLMKILLEKTEPEGRTKKCPSIDEMLVLSKQYNERIYEVLKDFKDMNSLLDPPNSPLLQNPPLFKHIATCYHCTMWLSAYNSPTSIGTLGDLKKQFKPSEINKVKIILRTTKKMQNQAIDLSLKRSEENQKEIK
jgi:hypothetical protein